MKEGMNTRLLIINAITFAVALAAILTVTTIFFMAIEFIPVR